LPQASVPYSLQASPLVWPRLAAQLTMGAGGSVDPQAGFYQLENKTVLHSLADVNASHEADKYRVALKRNEEILQREEHHCGVAGFQTRARHTQPLMRDKLECSLAYLDDVAGAYSSDQRRRHGHTQTSSDVLTSGGPIRAICPLGDDATIACASATGALWVYNWREGAVISRMRCEDGRNQNHDGPIVRLATASADGGLLASGDQHGMMVLWDLTGPRAACESRLHHGAIKGLRYDGNSEMLFTTSEDTYIMVFDLKTQTILDRAKPASCTDGDGIPSTALTLAGQGRSKLMLVGGADGKLRVWSRDGGSFRKQFVVPCHNTQPTQMFMTANGWHAALATCPADPILCGTKPGPGGLLLFDIRKFGGDNTSALVGEHRTKGCVHEGVPTGSIDMALVENENETIALCITDGVLRGFDLHRATGGKLPGLSSHPSSPRLASPASRQPSRPLSPAAATPIAERPVSPVPIASLSSRPASSSSHQVSLLAEEVPVAFDFDVVADFDGTRHPEPYPCAVACSANFVFTGTTAPSLGIWRRSQPNEPYGHSNFVRPPLPPLVLRSRCVPLRPVPADGVTTHASFSHGYGATLAAVEAALERDRHKAGEDFLSYQRPEAPTPRTAMAGPGF